MSQYKVVKSSKTGLLMYHVTFEGSFMRAFSTLKEARSFVKEHSTILGMG